MRTHRFDMLATSLLRRNRERTSEIIGAIRARRCTMDDGAVDSGVAPRWERAANARVAKGQKGEGEPRLRAMGTTAIGAECTGNSRSLPASDG